MIVRRQREEMLDDSNHVLARHRRNRLSWNMRVVPGENPARSDKLTLAGLGLQATDTPQVIQIRGEQWRMRTGFDGWRRKPVGRDSACKLDRPPCSYTGRFCRMVTNKPIDHRLINRYRSTLAGHESAESPEPTDRREPATPSAEGLATRGAVDEMIGDALRTGTLA